MTASPSLPRPSLVVASLLLSLSRARAEEGAESRLECYREIGVDNQRHIVSIKPTGSLHCIKTQNHNKKVKTPYWGTAHPNPPPPPLLLPFSRHGVPVHYITRLCTCVLQHNTSPHSSRGNSTHTHTL